ncbi:hypothetical protein NQ315_004026 [Exocentrus adspersus]|uniref:Tyr recombinase domain-containing protein n=3 Tax=Exocentrus adspersus TaxID=1586481 RepID=A0AAV8W6U6_9CUCU|nr:hypothetical protein NQ315_008450 [Exocentrus adspersus]KAJ8922094.1 hypothetical protein NQ315_004026 [Exocentrus adspersus]
MENFELEDAVKEVMDGILPKKSRKIYEAQYDTFVKWCCQRKLENVNEDVLLKSKTLSSSTLWAHYSMLKTMLNVKRNIDVSKFYKLSAFLKRKSEGYKPKNAKVLTLDQIDKFLLEVPDKDFLMIKVALIFGVAGACRGKELHQLTISDVTDMDHALLVNVRNTKNNVDRNFIINNSNKNGIDLIEVCRKYMALRKPETTHSRFFVRYEKSQCTVQAIGKNTFGKIPQKVAEYLNLPNSTLYTGHCFRRTSASLLADSGASIDVWKRHGGWKSASVAEGYIENSINTKKIVADSIFGLGVGNSTESASAHQVSGSAVSASSASSTSSKNNILQNTIDGANRLLNIVNCSNVNIHVNINTNNKDL